MWPQHVQTMDTDRLPKVAKTCTDDGHRQTAKSGYNMYRGCTDRLPNMATTCTDDGHRQVAKRG